MFPQKRKRKQEKIIKLKSGGRMYKTGVKVKG